MLWLYGLVIYHSNAINVFQVFYSGLKNMTRNKNHMVHLQILRIKKNNHKHLKIKIKWSINHSSSLFLFLSKHTLLEFFLCMMKLQDFITE